MFGCCVQGQAGSNGDGGFQGPRGPPGNPGVNGRDGLPGESGRPVSCLSYGLLHLVNEDGFFVMSCFYLVLPPG